MKTLLSLLSISTLLIFSCKEEPQAVTTSVSETDQQEWPKIDTSSTFEELVLPEGFSYQVLFSEGDSVNTGDTTAPAKGNHDCIVYLPQDTTSSRGILFVSHETRGKNAILGDGGGATIFEVEQVNEQWNVVSKFNNVDYSPVGGTYNNCGGKNTPLGSILTAEEDAPSGMEKIAPHFENLEEVNGFPKHLNFGYMVEVDPKSRTALHKLYQMGRFVHEDALAMPDSQTVFLTQDDNPAIFWKFVAHKKGDYTQGQLYAYSQTKDASFDHWLPMPMDTASLFNITEAAVAEGATLFQRHEWMTRVGNKIYITETGRDSFDWNSLIKKGGVPAHYFKDLGDMGIYKDPYGRVLVYDLETEEMQVLLNGGTKPDDPTFCFSNPDGLTSFLWKGKNYLFISEDITGLDQNRTLKAHTAVNEAFILDLSIESPSLNDLKRFLIAPAGCETTGGFFSPDGKTLFLSIQHPNKTNPAPFNKSCVIAIRGF